MAYRVGQTSRLSLTWEKLPSEEFVAAASRQRTMAEILEGGDRRALNSSLRQESTRNGAKA